MAGDARDGRAGGAAPPVASRRPARDAGGPLLGPAAAARPGGAPALTPSPSVRYGWKAIPGSSHEILRRRLLSLPPGLSLLDLGAGAGHLGSAVRGHFGHLAGVEEDAAAAAPGGQLYDRWVCAPLAPGLPLDRAYDVIVCADVLEHLGDPEAMLPAIRGWLAPGGLLFVSLPNVANVTVRLSLLAGKFEYAERGILDRTHVRFYTRRSARQLLEEAGFRIEATMATAMPAELALPALGRFPLRATARALLAAASRVWPTMFGYQFLFEARRT